MTSINESDVDEAILKALEHPQLVEALNSISEWEHERALNHFLSTGQRETNYAHLITQVLRRHPLSNHQPEEIHHECI